VVLGVGAVMNPRTLGLEREEWTQGLKIRVVAEKIEDAVETEDEGLGLDEQAQRWEILTG
jgi:hypothetical protein